MPSTLENTARKPAFKPADLLPSYQPPYAVVRPAVPACNARIAFTVPSQDHSSNNKVEWISTTHFYPAAWPRSHNRSAKSSMYEPSLPSTSALPTLPKDAAASKEEQKKRRQVDLATWKRICGGPEKEAQVLRMEELRDCGEKSHHAERLSEARASKEESLWMCVSRIVPLSNDATSKARSAEPGLTLIVCHANGFHKEIFEPALAALLQKLSTNEHRGKHQIDEIWNFDTTHSGQAAGVNRNVLGDTVSWTDHARDLLQFFDSYLPDHVDVGDPTPWLPTFLAHSKRATQSCQKRRFVALGHSFGGAALTYTLHSRPNLLEGLILIDPALFEFEDQNFDTKKLPTDSLALMCDTPLATGAIVRKDLFDSMPDARAYFESKAFFRAWDSRVLDLHLRFGLRPADMSSCLVADDVEENDLKRTRLELTNTKWHEAAAFASTFMGRSGRAGLVAGKYRAWTALLNMQTGFNNQVLARDMAKLDSSVEFTVKGNHLVAQEDPDSLADYLIKALDVHSSSELLREHKLSAQVAKPRL